MQWLQRNIFLFDGLGAIGSTTATLAIVLAFQPYFGVPVATLWGLVLLAVGFVAYSLACWNRGAALRPWLAVVMTANLAYCVVVAAVLVNHASTMTRLGTAYFLGEILVIVGVVTLEWQVLKAAAR